MLQFNFCLKPSKREREREVFSLLIVSGVSKCSTAPPLSVMDFTSLGMMASRNPCWFSSDTKSTP